MIRKPSNKKEKRSLKQLTFYNKHGERTVAGKFFYDVEGNLKAVPVGITTVLALIFFISFVVQVKEPAEETVVKVTHLFQAHPPQTESQKTVEKKPLEEQKSIEKKEDEEEKTKEDKDMLETNKKLKAEDSIETIKTKIEKTKKETEQMKQEAEKRLAEAKPIKQETGKLNSIIKKSQSVKNKRIETLENELIKREATLEETDTKNAAQRAQLREAEEKQSKVELKQNSTEEERQILQDDFQHAKLEKSKDKTLEKVQKKSKEIEAQAEDVQDKSETVNNEVVKFRKSSVDVKEKSKGTGFQLSALANESKWLETKGKIASLEISNEDYTKLYQSRITSGANEPETVYRWRVSNQHGLKLKDCYTLFDMKAVLVTKENRYYDLGDLSQLTEDYLNANYSSTVILCENPGVDFAEKIRVLGVSVQDITIRYYMYGHTRNYFYNRVEQAVRCCLQQGNIPKDNDWQDHIDVVGNVYKIKKTRGGFGVFVPNAIYFHRPNSTSSEEMQVSPACFANEEDVKVLQANNML